MARYDPATLLAFVPPDMRDVEPPLQQRSMTPKAAAIAAVNQTAGDPLIAAKCRALIHGYDQRFRDSDIVPETVERMETANLYNPATSRQSRTYSLAGVLDVVGPRAGRRVLVDHKTTSQDITDPDGSFWRQLVVEAQPSFYMLLKWLNGQKIDEAVWDVMRKPQIAPKGLTKALQKSVVACNFQNNETGPFIGEYYDCKVVIGSPQQWDGRETLPMYEARLIDDCTKQRPHYYFQRRSVPRLDSEIVEYAGELWQHAEEIRQARNHNRHTRNSAACMLYGSPCRFLGICSGFDTPDSDKWVRKPCVHTELPALGGDGRDVLTQSRIRCFQLCHRKHFYEYELGIERVDEEEREALMFGTLWHQALAAWWSALLPLEKETCDESTSCPANSVGNRDRTESNGIVG